LSVFVQIARPLILTFGSAELFMLALFGLSMVGVLSGRSLVKGLTACAIGLVAGSIGGAPATGEFRLTFGIDYFYDGLPLVIVGIGLFAFPEIVDLLRRDRPIAAGGELKGGWTQGFRDVARNWWLCLRCASLGTLIGAIPGLGGTVVDWIAYGHVVQTSKDKSRFGKGDIRGVIAPESANNAKEGGGLVPTLLFGIPGSGAMAVFLGGLVLLGIEAGPAMVSSDIELTYTIIWSLALANVLGAGTCILLAKPIARLTTIPFNLLAPFMIMVVTFAAFQATRDLMDLVMLFAIGVVGIFLKRFGWSRPAFLIGFVLAPQAEGYLNLAVQFYGWEMLVRPGVLIIFAFAAVSVWLGMRGGIVDAEPTGDPQAGQAEDRRPQLAFIAGVMALSAYAIVSSQRLSPLGSMFPTGVALTTLALAAFLATRIAFGPLDHPLNFDLEADRDAAELPIGRRLWPNVAWFAVLTLATALLGFVIAILVFFVAFLRTKARASWPQTLVLTAAAVGVLSLLTNALLVELPTGLLPVLVDLPWR
jgi:TctA family transporter